MTESGNDGGDDDDSKTTSSARGSGNGNDDHDDPNNNSKKKKKTSTTSAAFSEIMAEGAKSLLKNTQKEFVEAGKGFKQFQAEVKSTFEKAADDTTEFSNKIMAKKVGFDKTTSLLGGKSSTTAKKGGYGSTFTTDDDDDDEEHDDDDNKSKNMSRTVREDVKSSITFENEKEEESSSSLTSKDIINKKQQQPPPTRKVVVAKRPVAAGAAAAKTTTTTTTTTITDTARSIFTTTTTMPIIGKFVPSVLVIILILVGTIYVYYDSLVYEGRVPVILIPIWFLLGIFVSQMFFVRSVTSVLPTNTAEDEATLRRRFESMKNDDSFVRRPTNHISTPIDDDGTSSREFHEPQRPIVKKSTRKDMFSYFDDMFNNSKKTKKRSSSSDGGGGGDRSTRSTASTTDFANYFTNLSKGNVDDENNPMKRKFWEDLTKAETNDELMELMLVKFGMKEKTEQANGSSEDTTTTPGEGGEESEEMVSTDITMGHVSNDNIRAEKLEKNMVIEPLFTLRGIDVFRPTNGPAEEKIWRQPILEENGLFDVPTFVVNLMLPWYNLVLYFQMPKWVKSFTDITEHDDDSEDTKALKRFLLGDAEYRYPRWKILPCLVDAPYIIKAIAPGFEETAIGRPGRVPVKWHQYDERKDPKTGKVTRRALLEADVDLVTDAQIRKVLGIIKGSVSKVTIDCAMIIDKPYLSETPEPKACMGLWRLDKLDMENAAIIPEKDERQLLQDFMTMLPEGTDYTNSIRNLLANKNDTTVAAGA